MVGLARDALVRAGCVSVGKRRIVTEVDLVGAAVACAARDDGPALVALEAFEAVGAIGVRSAIADAGLEACGAQLLLEVLRGCLHLEFDEHIAAVHPRRARDMPRGRGRGSGRGRGGCNGKLIRLVMIVTLHFGARFRCKAEVVAVTCPGCFSIFAHSETDCVAPFAPRPAVQRICLSPAGLGASVDALLHGARAVARIVVGHPYAKWVAHSAADVN